jgi:hypothetical protein
MKTTDDLIPIKQFIFESKTNLELATAVYNEYETARETIIKEFFDRVTKLLKRSKKLQAWEMAYDGGFFVQDYACYRLHKKIWQDRYDIRIEAWQYGERMIYGVWRDATVLDRVQRNSALLQAVRQRLPKAKARNYFEAEIWMDFPEPDWKKPKVIWRMLKDKKFELEVAALLSEIVDITEDHVDRLVKRDRTH